MCGHGLLACLLARLLVCCNGKKAKGLDTYLNALPSPPAGDKQRAGLRLAGALTAPAALPVQAVSFKLPCRCRGIFFVLTLLYITFAINQWLQFKQVRQCQQSSS